MASTDSALDHLEIGAAELLATAPDGLWTERQRDRLAKVHDYLKAAQFAHGKTEYLRRYGRRDI
jgi:hypothetical protein